MLLHLVLKNRSRDKTPFLRIGYAAVQFNLGTLIVGGPDHFFQLVFVPRDDGIGRVDDILGRPVVLFQAVYRHIIVIPLKIQDVADVGPPEGVYTLCVVPHHANILVAV